MKARSVGRGCGGRNRVSASAAPLVGLCNCGIRVSPAPCGGPFGLPAVHLDELVAREVAALSNGWRDGINDLLVVCAVPVSRSPLPDFRDRKAWFAAFQRQAGVSGLH